MGKWCICFDIRQRAAPFQRSYLERILASGARNPLHVESGLHMYLILAVVLVLLWLGGLVMLKTAGLLIHLLLLFAVIALVMHVVAGRRTV